MLYRLVIFLIIIIFFNFVIGCSNNEKIEKIVNNDNTATVEDNIEISSVEVENKLKVLSEGLNVKYDNIKDIRYYQCPIIYEIGIYLFPYVAVDKDYNIKLFDLPFVFGDEWIFFDEIYLKANNKLYKNSYKNYKRNTEPSGKYITESYNVEMNPEWYKALNESLNVSHIKINFRASMKLIKI